VEYTCSGRNEDVSQKGTAYDPTKTDPKEQKHAVRKEEVYTLYSRRKVKRLEW